MRNFFLSLLCFLLISAADGIKLKKIKLEKGVTIGITENMRPMTDNEIARTYISSRNALGWFTDGRGKIDLVINTASTPWAPKDLAMLRDIQKSSIYNLYDEVEMIEENFYEANGREFFSFEFIGTVNGEENSVNQRDNIVKYILISYTINAGEVFVTSFTCPPPLQKEWQEPARAIMQSIKIK